MGYLDFTHNLNALRKAKNDIGQIMDQLMTNSGHD